MRITTSLCAFTFTITPTFAYQSVHVVNGGGPDALQAAIDGAASGDTVLVHGGVYSTASILGKSLTLVAEPALATRVTTLVVAGLAADQRCVVAGLDVLATIEPPIRLNNNAGRVRFQGIRSRPSGNNSADALVVNDCADVICVASTFQGGAQIPTPGPDLDPSYPAGRGIGCEDSQLALYDCVVVGGAGQTDHFINAVFGSSGAGVGGSALVSNPGSTIFASRTSFTGGEGGRGRNLSCVHLPCGIAPTAGGVGGTGIDANPGAVVALIESVVQGGNGGLGGTGGQCCPQTTWPSGATGAAGAAESGAITHYPGTSTTLATAHVVRAGDSLALTVLAAPGSTIFLGVSSQTRFTFDAVYQGVFVLGNPARRSTIGIVPGNGMLSLSIPPGALPPGAQSIERYLQVLAREPGGPLRVGAPAFVTLLDPAF